MDVQTERLTGYRKECRILQILNHEHIVKLIDWLEDDECVDLTRRFRLNFENYHCGTLAAAIDASSTKFPAKTIASWAEGIFRGLAHIHAPPFTHLTINIEPETIFVTAQFTLKLGGFCAVDTPETLRYKSLYKKNENGGDEIRAVQKDAVHSAALVVWEITERSVVFGEYGRRGEFRRADFLNDISHEKLAQLETPSFENDEAKEIMRRSLSFDYSLRPTALETYAVFNQRDAEPESPGSTFRSQAPSHNSSSSQMSSSNDGGEQSGSLKFDSLKITNFPLSEMLSILIKNFDKRKDNFIGTFDKSFHESFTRKFDCLTTSKQEDFIQNIFGYIGQLNLGKYSYSEKAEIEKILAENQDRILSINEAFEMLCLSDLYTFMEIFDKFFNLLEDIEKYLLSSWSYYQRIQRLISNLEILSQTRPDFSIHFRCFVQVSHF